MKLKWEKVRDHYYKRQEATRNGLTFAIERITRNKRFAFWATRVSRDHNEYCGTVVYDRIRDAKRECQAFADAMFGKEA